MLATDDDDKSTSFCPLTLVFCADCLSPQILDELVFDESGRCDEDAFDDLEVDVAQNRLEDGLVELGQSFVVLGTVAFPFPRDVYL